MAPTQSGDTLGLSLPPRGTSTEPQPCPTHWHATFAVFIPGTGGSPLRVDFASPRTPNGHPYYDLGSSTAGGDAKMTYALHMHQSGGESSGAQLDQAQWHMEASTCTFVGEALHIVDVDVSNETLRLSGGHTQVTGQSGTFAVTAASPLRSWLQTENGTAWQWSERPWSEVSGHQMRNGEALLVALGSYDDAQVAFMQSQVAAPATRTV